MSFALVSIWKYKQAQLPDVEKTIYTATDEAWKEYEVDANPPNPNHVVYPPRN
jgi:hypothetical protein